METPLIEYNLRDRGRSYRGQERNFDIPALSRVINGPACQERVRNRDMVGFYGHWPRVKFGMNPAEGGMDGGKARAVQPALVTTFLDCSTDGTVRHKAEFLPTEAGTLAEKLFSARTGGFSSAIDTHRPEFFGFDYVLEPNYSTNRGYSLDSVFGGADGMSIDDIDAAIYGEQVAGMAVLLDAVQGSLHASASTLEALRAERDDLARRLDDMARQLEERMALDGVFIRPAIVERSRAERILAEAEEFRAAQLLRVEEPVHPQPLPGYDRLMSRFRVPR